MSQLFQLPILLCFLYGIVVQTYYTVGNLVGRLVTSSEFFIDIGLLLLIYRFKWEKTPNVMYIPLVAMGVLGIWVIIDTSLYFGHYPAGQVGWTINIFIRCSVALYVLLTSSYLGEARRLRFSKGLWIYGIGIGNLLTQTIVVITFYIPQNSIEEVPLSALIVALSFTVLAYFTFLINHIFFPEAVLLSSTVLGRATDLYSTVSSHGGSGIQALGLLTIKD